MAVHLSYIRYFLKILPIFMEQISNLQSNPKTDASWKLLWINRYRNVAECSYYNFTIFFLQLLKKIDCNISIP